jgi:hypothetical protein
MYSTSVEIIWLLDHDLSISENQMTAQYYLDLSLHVESDYDYNESMVLI